MMRHARAAVSVSRAVFGTRAIDIIMWARHKFLVIGHCVYQFSQTDANLCKQLVHQFRLKAVFVGNEHEHFLSLSGKPPCFCVCLSATRQHKHTCITSLHGFYIVLELPFASGCARLDWYCSGDHSMQSASTSVR
jgi:hypothetical protein